MSFLSHLIQTPTTKKGRRFQKNPSQRKQKGKKVTKKVIRLKGKKPIKSRAPSERQVAQFLAKRQLQSVPLNYAPLQEKRVHQEIHRYE